MIKQNWCYQCRANTDHYLFKQTGFNIEEDLWICEECGQDAADRSYVESDADTDTSFLDEIDDDDYNNLGILGRF